MEDATKKFAIATILVLVIALVSMDFNGITGNVPSADKVTFISAEQLKDEYGRYRPSIIVKLYPRGGAGNPGKWIDMQLIKGTKHADEKTECDEYGTKIGSAECEEFERAVFDITGTTWGAGERVQFSIRGTNIKSNPLTIIK